MQSLKFLARDRILLILANLLVAGIVFYVMGAKHTTIGFHADDYGFIYNGRYNSLQDIKTIFSNSDMITCAGTMLDKNVPVQKNFLETLYRPLVLLVMGTEYKLFGMNAYHFHLAHTTLHTITTLTILNVVALYGGLLCAVPLALFWGLHSNLKDYFFWQCYIQNSIEAVLLCAITLLFLLWYRRRWMIALVAYLVLFFIALLLRETLIALPVLAGLFAWLDELQKNIQRRKSASPARVIPAKAGTQSSSAYFSSQKLQCLIKFLIFKFRTGSQPSLGRRAEDSLIRNHFYKALTTTALFLIPIIAYMSLRLWAHPFSTSVQCIGIKNFSQTNHSLLHTINLKFFDWVAWFMDMLGLHWLPKGYTLLKLSALVTLGYFVVTMWRKNAYTNYLIILASSLVLLGWPSLLLCHCSRYLYLPTLSFTLLLGLLTSKLTTKSKLLFCLFFTSYAALQGIVTNKRMNFWAAQTALEQARIATFALNPSDEKIVQHSGTGTSPGITLYREP